MAKAKKYRVDKYNRVKTTILIDKNILDEAMRENINISDIVEKTLLYETGKITAEQGIKVISAYMETLSEIYSEIEKDFGNLDPKFEKGEKIIKEINNTLKRVKL